MARFQRSPIRPNRRDCLNRQQAIEFFLQNKEEHNSSGIKLLPLFGAGERSEYWVSFVNKLCQQSGFVGGKWCSLDGLVSLALKQARQLGFDISHYRQHPAGLKEKFRTVLPAMAERGLVYLRDEGGGVEISLYQM